jgi:hypothetical protein
MRAVGHVARTGKMRNANKIFLEKPEGRYHSQGLDIDDRIIIKWFLGKQGGRMWTV